MASAIPLTKKTAEPFWFAPAELVVYENELVGIRVSRIAKQDRNDGRRERAMRLRDSKTMRTARSSVLCVLVLTLFASTARGEVSRTQELIAENTEWENPYYVTDSGVEGPALLVLKQAKAEPFFHQVFATASRVPEAVRSPTGGVCSSCRCFMECRFLGQALRRYRSIQTSASIESVSATQRLAQLFHQTKEHGLPRVPGQKTIDDLSRRANDLGWNVDHRIAERDEVHP